MSALDIRPAILDTIAQTTTLVDYPGRTERFLPGTSLLRCRISPSNPRILVVVGVLAATDMPSIVIWSVSTDDPSKSTHEIVIPLTSPTVTSLDISPDCRSVMVVVTSHDRSDESAILVSSGVTLPASGSIQPSVRTPGSSSCGGSSVGSKLTPQSTESRPCLQSEVVVWVELAGGLPEPPTAIAWIEYSPVVVSSTEALPEEEAVTYVCMGFLTGEVTLIDADGADGGNVESQFNCRTPVTNIEVIPTQGAAPVLLVHLSASPCFFLLMTAVDSLTGALRLEAHVLPLPCPDPRSVRFFSDDDTWYISTLSNCGSCVYMSILPEGDSTAAVTPVARIPTAGRIPIVDHSLVSPSHDCSQRRSILVANLGGSIALMTASAAGCDNIILAVVPYSPSPTVRLLAPTAGKSLILSTLCFATVSPATLYRLEFQNRNRIQAAVEACVAKAAIECLPRSSKGGVSRQFFETGFPLMCQALGDLVDLDDVCLAAGLRVMDTPDHSPYEKLCCCLLVWRQRYSTKPVPFPVVRALLLHVVEKSGEEGVTSSGRVTPEDLGNYRLLVDGQEPVIPFEYFVGVVSADGRALERPGLFKEHWGPGSDLGSGGMLIHPVRRLWILELALSMMLGRRLSSAFVQEWLDETNSRPMIYSSSRRGFQYLVELALHKFRATWSDVADLAKTLSPPLGGALGTVGRFVGLPSGCDVGIPVILAILANSCSFGVWKSAGMDTLELVTRVGDTVKKCWLVDSLPWSRHSDALVAILRLMRRVWELLVAIREAHVESLEIKPVMRTLPTSDSAVAFRSIVKAMEDRVDEASAPHGPVWTSSDDGLYRIASQARWLMYDGGSVEDFTRVEVDEDLEVMRKLTIILRRDGRLWKELPWSQKFRLRLIRQVVVDGNRSSHGA